MGDGGRERRVSAGHVAGEANAAASMTDAARRAGAPDPLSVRVQSRVYTCAPPTACWCRRRHADVMQLIVRRSRRRILAAFKASTARRFCSRESGFNLVGYTMPLSPSVRSSGGDALIRRWKSSAGARAVPASSKCHREGLAALDAAVGATRDRAAGWYRRAVASFATFSSRSTAPSSATPPRRIHPVRNRGPPSTHCVTGIRSPNGKISDADSPTQSATPSGAGGNAAGNPLSASAAAPAQADAEYCSNCGARGLR
jgi:hypothetical protein